jgi:hypothetical protein
MFAGPYIRLRFINNNIFTGIGGGGIVCWDQHYYLYLQYATYASDEPINDGIEMQLASGGGTIGYIFFPQNEIHFSTGIQFASNDIAFRESNGLNINHDMWFFSIAPEINVEVNVLKTLRLYLGTSWNFTLTDDDYLGLNWKTLSGFSINFGFLMGKF